MPNKHPLLSRSFLALLLSLSSTLTFAAVQQSPIAGHWEGAIKLPTGSLNFSVDFTVASDGKVVLTNLNGTPLRDLITQVAADRLFKLSQITGSRRPRRGAR